MRILRPATQQARGLLAARRLGSGFPAPSALADLFKIARFTPPNQLDNSRKTKFFQGKCGGKDAPLRWDIGGQPGEACRGAASSRWVCFPGLSPGRAGPRKKAPRPEGLGAFIGLGDSKILDGIGSPGTDPGKDPCSRFPDRRLPLSTRFIGNRPRRTP